MDAWIQLSDARVTSLAIYIVPIYDRNHHVGCTVHVYECKTRVIYIFITQSDQHSLFKHVIFIVQIPIHSFLLEKTNHQLVHKNKYMFS